MQASYRCVAAMALLLAATAEAPAAIVSFSQTVTGFANANGFRPPDPFSITFTDLPLSASAAGGILKLETHGDFDFHDEWIDVSVDDLSLGRLWDNDTTNDRFAGVSVDDDDGQQYSAAGSNSAATATLLPSELDALLADGSIRISFDQFGPGVTDIETSAEDEFITATLSYESASAIAVPEPGYAALLLFGTLGILLWRLIPPTPFCIFCPNSF